MIRKMINFGKQHREFPNLSVSFVTRSKAMEVCFGNIDNEESNISASILRSILSLNMD